MVRTCAPQVDSAATFKSFATSLLSSFVESRPSVLLSVIFGPIAIIVMIIAQIKRLFAVGSVYFNVSHVVSADPALMNQLLALPAVELARRVKLPRSDPECLTSLQLIDLYIDQIARSNIYVNAVVATRFEEARAEARVKDAAVEAGKVPINSPLWGVPTVLKECFEYPDLPYTVGIVGRKGKVGKNINPGILQLQEAGAIVLASTNVSEGTMWHESSNQVRIYACIL
jgi:hypothetical protein